MKDRLKQYIKSNDKFTRLTILKRVEHKNDRKHVWVEARCTCGKIGVYRQDRLFSNITRSCGCLAKFLKRKRPDNIPSFQSSDAHLTRVYNAWIHIKQRVSNPNCPDYLDYGGRDIGMKKEWFESFIAFYCYIGDPTSSSHSIGRINNNGDYDLFNIAWQTPWEQSRNTRRNVWVTINDETLCLKDWWNRYNLPSGTYYQRIKKGWTPEQAITTPRKRAL